ncbi:Piwi domain-containing protein [Polaribacter aestuariivivens]|uniref:Piwi domain-containing protein n=1 Tax=Polaribacter aestuariivivens TaxID=2304626 RepID=UPI003F499AFE
MSKNLSFNILSFNWPKKQPIFYFTIQETLNSHPIHKYKWSSKILNAFPELNNTELEHIYTTYTTKTKGGIAIEIEMYKKDLLIYKQFLKHQLRNYFKEKGFIVTKNFIRDIQVWLPAKKTTHPLFQQYYKFSLKLQFAQVSEHPELVVSFDGLAKVLNIPISDIEDTTLVKRTVYKNTVFNYQKLKDPNKQDFYNSLEFNKVFPLLTRALASAYNIPESAPNRNNKYCKYVNNIASFAKTYLLTEEFKKIIPVYGNNFLKVPIKLLNRINAKKGELEYANKNKGLFPKKELGKFKPYRRPENPNIKFFFILHKSHQEKIRTLYSYLTKGTGVGTYYQGLEKYINIKVKLSNEHFITYKNASNPIPEICAQLEKLDFNHDNVRYAAFYISPFNKFTPNKEDRLVYVKVKELLLNEGIVTQALDYNKMQNDLSKPKNYQYTLHNISLAIHAKLGGVPWKLAVTEKKELVIGLGAFMFQEEKRRYIASAFSFQNNGLFRGFDYFSENNNNALAGSICKKIREFSNQVKTEKVVIHFYKDMSEKEIKPIKEGMQKLGLNVPLYILNINKTEAQDIIAFDNDWQELMPKSGTFIRIGNNKFLLFNNARYNNDNKYPAAEGYPFPIKISISSPDKDAFEDANITLELLTQVYQFSRLYWKSLRQQNVPITIKYPEMVAQIAPRFQGNIPDHAKDKLWFL